VAAEGVELVDSVGEADCLEQETAKIATPAAIISKIIFFIFVRIRFRPPFKRNLTADG
jgi:hypothetical protein